MKVILNLSYYDLKRDRPVQRAILYPCATVQINVYSMIQTVWQTQESDSLKAQYN